MSKTQYHETLGVVNEYVLSCMFIAFDNEANRLDAEARSCKADEPKLEGLVFQYNAMNDLRNKAAAALGYDFVGKKKRRKAAKTIRKVVQLESRLFVMDEV